MGQLDHQQIVTEKCSADPAVNKMTATSAVQRILPGSEEAMEEAVPSNPSEQ